MATSGYVDSWVSNHSTGSGAFYRWHWESSYVSPGVTKISWKLQGRGRTSSPTWLTNECHISVTQAGQIYSMEWDVGQSAGDGTNTSFNHNSDKSWRTSGSFNVQHSDANALTLTVTIMASFWAGNNTGKTTTSTITIDANPPGLVRIYVNGAWKQAIPYVYNGGWKQAIPYVYNNGWKIST